MTPETVAKFNEHIIKTDLENELHSTKDVREMLISCMFHASEAQIDILTLKQIREKYPERYKRLEILAQLQITSYKHNKNV